MSEQAAPLLRVVRGDPTDEELAALLAVLGAQSAAEARLPRPRSAWSDPARLVRRPVAAGPGGWRRSVLPS